MIRILGIVIGWMIEDMARCKAGEVALAEARRQIEADMRLRGDSCYRPPIQWMSIVQRAIWGGLSAALLLMIWRLL